MTTRKDSHNLQGNQSLPGKPHKLSTLKVLRVTLTPKSPLEAYLSSLPWALVI